MTEEQKREARIKEELQFKADPLEPLGLAEFLSNKAWDKWAKKQGVK